MALSSRSFFAEAVLALLDQQEEFDDAIGGDIDGKSEDDDHPEGDFTDHDGTESLVQPEMLASSGLSLVAEAFDHPEPSLRDSLLFLDSELCDDATRSTPDLPTSKCEIILAKFDTSRWLVLVLLDLFAA